MGGLPYSSTGLIRLLGAVEGDIRAVLDLLAAEPALAERLESLASGEEAMMEPDLDDRLIASGVVTVSKTGPQGTRVQLRAPLLAAVLG